MSKKPDKYPIRGKIALSMISIVFSLSIYAFRVYEGLSWLDSIYFLTVTISTTGFGDITPTHSFTKAVLVLLIITGISTIAIISEITLDKVIKLRLSPNLELSGLIEYNDHIIIGGYNIVAENLSLMARDRFFEVVIIDDDEEKIRNARLAGHEAYLGNIENPHILENLNLLGAIGLYLFLDDDNITIQTAILAKQLDPTLLIYASTRTHLSIDFGKLVGINRTYHDERLLASFIQTTSKEYNSVLLPNQDVPKSMFRVILLKSIEQSLGLDSNAMAIGHLAKNFTSLNIFDNKISHTEADIIGKDGILVMVVTKYDDISNVGSASDDVPMKYRKIIFCGWSEKTEHMMEHLDFEASDFTFLTFSEDKYNLAKNKGIDIIYSTKEDIKEKLEELTNENDLIVNLFENLPDALLLDVIVKQLEKPPLIMQVVENSAEIDVFLRIGVDHIISPDVLTSRGMFLILLRDTQQIASLIYRNGHIFEHVVTQGDPFHGINSDKMSDLGYRLLIHNKAGERSCTLHPKSFILKEGDHIMLFKENSVFTKMRSKS